jgi:hypothetical protein
MGRFPEAMARCLDALEYFESVDPLSSRSEHAMALAVHAAAGFRTIGPVAAYDSAMRAASLLCATPPVAYWMLCGMTQTLEVLFLLLEDRSFAERRPQLLGQVRGVLTAARRFARMFPIGRPEVLLASGTLAWHVGQRRRAMRRWQRAAVAADRLQMPYELGRAHAEMGRHLDPGKERWRHLVDAAAIFDRIGCGADAARVRVFQDEGGTAAWQASSVA